MNAAASKIKEWQASSGLFAREVFGITPDAWQDEAFRAYDNHERVALRSGAGPGKTFMLAILGWHALSLFGDRGDHPKGAALSCTQDNLETGLWPEMAKWWHRSEFLKSQFICGAESIKQRDYPDTWFLKKRSFAKSATAEAQGESLSGLHSGYPFVLADESGSISPMVALRAEQIFSGGLKRGRVITAGNTTSKDGMLFYACNSGRWAVVAITCDPDDPNRSPRGMDIELAKSMIKERGRDDPWVMAYILGQFPTAAIDTLLSHEEVDAAVKRYYKDLSGHEMRMGVDVARQGLDSTVFAPRRGLQAYPMIKIRGQDYPSIARAAITQALDLKCDQIYVDATGGFGWGVIDFLRTMGSKPIPVTASQKASDPNQYCNTRAECIWRMRDWVKNGGALQDDPKLRRQLTSVTYSFKDGKILIGDKTILKTILGYSPDEMDALSLTFAVPDRPVVDPLEHMIQTRWRPSVKTFDVDAYLG